MGDGLATGADGVVRCWWCGDKPALKARGARFVGPTIVYAFMQSAGLVDDHVSGCHRAGS